MAREILLTHSSGLETHLPFPVLLAGTNPSVLKPRPTEGAHGASVAALSFGLSFGRDFSLTQLLLEQRVTNPQIHKPRVHISPWLGENNFHSYCL